ncbi:MAG: pantoate--beta-alanine ligase [Planctomycetota bacterium]|nr:pantoate--beta-alanine ligase [Planctomycetota bacterium]
MKVLTSQAEILALPALSTAMVPTMGALHEGHAALVRRAAELARSRGLAGVVVTVFVNPTQFNEQSDFARYPRTLDADVELCARAGATHVFAPGVDVVYPPGETIPTPALPEAATDPKLEDSHRPGHFAGVCQVVKRLFDLGRPALAVFGEKDWQQLAVIRAMTAREKLGVSIEPLATVREPEGLAMSSRNRFLTPADRPRALAISRALREAGLERDASSAQARMARVLGDAGIEPEYAVVRDAATLGPVQPGEPGRALIAARVGSVRLIDNMPWPN